MSTDIDSKIICGCFELNKSDIEAHIAQNPSQTFEAFLKETGAGSKCTACMLDIEYLFVESPRDGAAADKQATKKQTDRVPLKRRILSWLDRVTPMVALPLVDHMPVLYGGGVEQYLWIVNHPLLFEESGKEITFTVDIALYDSAGHKVFTDYRTVVPSEALRLNLTDHFPSEADITVGSLHVIRRGTKPSVRGTTRPQVEILTEKAATVLHCQAARGAYDKYFTFWPQANERVLFTVVNCDAESMDISLHFFESGSDDGPLVVDKFQLGPYCASLREVQIPPTKIADGGLVVGFLQVRGYGKIHVVNANADLSRLSIDHL